MNTGANPFAKKNTADLFTMLLDGPRVQSKLGLQVTGGTED